MENTRTEADQSFAAELAGCREFLWRVSQGHTRDRCLREDLVQEAMLRAWRFRSRYRPGTTLRAWVLVIFRRTVADYFRSRVARDRAAKALPVTDPAAPDGHAGLGAEGLDEAMIDRGDVLDDELRRWFLSQKPSVRKALLTIATRDPPWAQMAQELGVRKGTLGSRLNRARLSLPGGSS